MEFQLVAFVDLADLRHKHRLVFDLFKEVRQDRFEHNQRLVLYSAYTPEQDFLDHIQRAAARIDISNYFIMIVCPDDITASLTRCNGKFGYDDSIIQSRTITLTETKSFDKESGFAKIDSLCPLPFSQIFLDTTGAAYPCCKFKEAVGNVQDLTLSEIFLGHRLGDIRNQMVAGQQPSQCSICWHNESTGTTSHRQLALQKYGDSLDQAWLDDVQIRDMTWSAVGLCNFKCRICKPASSTAIAVEELLWTEDSNQKRSLRSLIKKITSSKKNIGLMLGPEKLHGLEYVHVMGGEPFIWPQLPKLIDELIEQNCSKRITIEFNTNASIFPDLQLQYIIANFKAVEILLSIDNIGRRFEIERGGTWSKILENIKKFASLKTPKVTVKFAITVNLQNVLYLDDVVELARSLDLDIVWTFLHKPKFLCIDYATDQVKDLVVLRYQHHHDTELRQIAARVVGSSGSDGTEFIAYTEKIDRRRSQCFSNTHREIYEAMGGCV